MQRSSEHKMQLFSNDASGLCHHVEIKLVALSQRGFWHGSYVFIYVRRALTQVLASGVP
jgi:hypothetical protein